MVIDSSQIIAPERSSADLGYKEEGTNVEDIEFLSNVSNQLDRSTVCRVRMYPVSSAFVRCFWMGRRRRSTIAMGCGGTRVLVRGAVVGKHYETSVPG